MFDLWQEIYSALKRNKLRTVLTGFAVAWGIFILIVLQGMGNGLMNAQDTHSADLAMNSIAVYPGTTTMSYDGLKQGRRVQLNNGDLALTAQLTDHVEEAGAIIYQGGVTINHGKEYVSETLQGVHPNFIDIERPKIVGGRFVNNLDIKEQRKVAVINLRTVKTLFKQEAPAAAIGKMLNMGGIMFRVVGVYKDRGNSSGQTIYIPFSTLQLVYNRGDKLNRILMTVKDLNTEEENEAFEAEYRAIIGKHQRFHPDDSGAIWISNRFTQMLQMNKAKEYLETAIWIIGLFTLLSGVVGISNIMLITVKERTHEFGIRKALGARPWSILKLVIVESVVITAFFGYIGMVAGIGVTEYLNIVAGSQTVDIGVAQQSTFLNPTVGLDVAIKATVTLIAAGTLAGLFPALKAVRTRPIEALRAD